MTARLLPLGVIGAALLLPGALLSAPSAAAVDHARVVDGWYLGATSQNEPVTLHVERKGARLAVRVAFPTETTCRGHATYTTGNTDYVNNVPINRSGQFRVTFKGQQNMRIGGRPGVDKYRFTVAGRFHGRHVSGTFYNEDDGYQSVPLFGGLGTELTYYGSCYTRGVTWTASWRKGKPG